MNGKTKCAGTVGYIEIKIFNFPAVHSSMNLLRQNTINIHDSLRLLVRFSHFSNLGIMYIFIIGSKQTECTFTITISEMEGLLASFMVQMGKITVLFVFDLKLFCCYIKV